MNVTVKGPLWLIGLDLKYYELAKHFFPNYQSSHHVEIVYHVDHPIVIQNGYFLLIKDSAQAKKESHTSPNYHPKWHC